MSNLAAVAGCGSTFGKTIDNPCGTDWAAHARDAEGGTAIRLPPVVFARFPLVKDGFLTTPPSGRHNLTRSGRQR